jgi:hypothetical protein
MVLFQKWMKWTFLHTKITYHIKNLQSEKKFSLFCFNTLMFIIYTYIYTKLTLNIIWQKQLHQITQYV